MNTTSIHADNDGEKILIGKFGQRQQPLTIQEMTLDEAELFLSELDEAVTRVKALTEQQLMEVKDFLGMMVQATKTGRLP